MGFSDHSELYTQYGYKTQHIRTSIIPKSPIFLSLRSPFLKDDRYITTLLVTTDGEIYITMCSSQKLCLRILRDGN